jgi:hypothetical protein
MPNTPETNLLDDLANAERPAGNGLIYNAKAEPSALDETFWMETLAATGDVIYDPLCDGFYQFADGLWNKVARPVIVEWVARQIAALCPEAPAKLRTRRAFNEIALRLSGHPATVRPDAFSKTPHGIILGAFMRASTRTPGAVRQNQYDGKPYGNRQRIIFIPKNS